MLGHLGVNVPDLVAAKQYYGALMPLLGFERFIDDDDQLAYMPAGGKRGTYLFFYPAPDRTTPYDRKGTGLQHLAFMVPTRTSVHVVHDWAAGAGGQILYEPQDFPQYPPPHFATFWVDPFGFVLEAVCHHDRP